MKNTFKKVFIGFMAFAMVTGSFAQQGAHKKDNESYPKGWKQIARMEQDSFFLTDEARRIAENVLAPTLYGRLAEEYRYGPPHE